ncbi:phosphotransferase [bacterium]|nr:phosphotransferase [bacterium]
MNQQVIISIIETSLNSRDFSLAEVTQGIMTNVQKIVTPNENYYFRATSEHKKSFQVFKEVYNSLTKLGAQIPKIIDAHTAEDSWMIVSEIKGKSYREIKDSLDSDTRKNILKETLKIISCFWKYQTKGFGYGDKTQLHQGKIQAPFATNFEFLTNSTQEKITRLITKEYLSPESIRIIETLTKYKSYLNAEISVFCHGDLSDKHIMVNNNQFSGIIDLDEYRCSSKFYDVAYLYSYLTPEEQDFIIEEMQELLSNEQNTKEKILVTNFFIALEDVVYMIDELKLDIPTHQHVLSMQNNLKTILALAS